MSFFSNRFCLDFILAYSRRAKVRTFKIMKLLFLIATMFLIPSYIHAQGFSGIGVSPSYITEMDDILILDTVELSSPDFRLNASIYNSSYTLFLQLCYRRAGGAQGGKSLNEVTNIGKLTKGRYQLKLIGTMTSDTGCFTGAPFFNELTTTFEVHAFPNGVNEVKEKVNLNLFPNPTENTTLLEIFASNHQQVNISLVDITGKLLLNKAVEVDGVKRIPIDLSDLTAGIYVLNIKSENISKTFKIMKQ